MIKSSYHNNKSNIIFDLQDYMFTSTNINRYTKHMIRFDPKPSSKSLPTIRELENKDRIERQEVNKKNIERKVIDEKKQTIKPKEIVIEKNMDKKIIEKKIIEKKIVEKKEKVKETRYRPKQKDSLFWCFYILKNGFSNFEMEINNQHFVIEKNEKFKYIEILRKSKDILKIHKIKPLTQLEDDLANKTNISIKTFFALCILENINVLLVDKRKVYELLCINVDDAHPVNVIHKYYNDYSIELDTTNEMIQNYKETYYKMGNFDTGLKGIGSYKSDELIDLCTKLNINIFKEGKKKLTKKDIYELLVLNY
jgi:hypothetical protein